MFLSICDRIHFPVALDKIYWATTSITFLGFLIDTVNQLILIPADKIERAIRMISTILNSAKHKATVLQIQKLCGFLNFLCRCVVPGRAFTRHLYSLTANPNLTQHHHIRLTQENCLDLQTWLQFLHHPTAYARPFLDYANTLVATTIDWFTDASGKIGFGGVWNKEWFHGKWDKDFLAEKKPSIEYLELFAVTISVLLWLENYRNSRIILFAITRVW